MMLVEKEKAQVMILDVLFFIIIVLLILSIETKIIMDYKTDITTKEKEIEVIKKDFFIDVYLLDCNYLGKIEPLTKKCTPYKIEVKNLDEINENICKIEIDKKEIFTRDKKIKTTLKRGVVYRNKFSVLEVGFCE